MNCTFLGPPGVGKGTIAKEIAKAKNIPHISTGDLLREAVKQDSELGRKVKKDMDSGKLVRDELVINLLKKRISQDDSKNGFIIDGFPRTMPQAESLKGEYKIEHAINFKASDKLVISRITGRRTCRKCGAIFHIKNIPPKVDGICDKCGGELYQREDDKEETIKKRLETYKQQTAPVIESYRKARILTDIETEKPLPEIIKDALAVVA